MAMLKQRPRVVIMSCDCMQPGVRRRHRPFVPRKGALLRHQLARELDLKTWHLNTGGTTDVLAVTMAKMRLFSGYRVV